MEMHQIRYFLAVAEELNFTRAAEACHVAQPSLSRAIRKLEEELGGDLFRRERNLTHMTNLGRQMQPILRQVFESAAEAKSQAANYRAGNSAPLRIGLSQTVSLDVIAPMLEELARAIPGLEIHISRAPAAGILESLKTDKIELGIVADMAAVWERLDYWPLFEEGFVLLAPPGWDRSTVTLSDIDENALIGRQYCESIAKRRPADETEKDGAKSRHEVSSDEDAASLVKRGLGIVIVPDSTGRSLPNTIVAIEDFDQTRTVQVFGVAGRQRSTAANAMLKLLRAADWSSPLSS